MGKRIFLIALVSLALFGSCSSIDMYATRMRMDEKAALSAAINNPDKLMPSYKTMDLSGYVGINYLVGMKNIEAVEKALDRKLNLNEIKKDGKTPLGQACYWGDAAVVKLLLDKGADPLLKDGNGVPPILNTFVMNDISSGEIIEALLLKGADINAVDAEGNTVLHILTKSFIESTPSKPDVSTIKERIGFYDGYYPETYLNTAKYLLSKGMNPNIKNKKGETPLSLLINAFPNLKKEQEPGRHLLYLQRARYAIFLANTLINAKAVISTSDTPADFWLVPLVGLTKTQMNKSLIEHCARIDYFDYDYIHTVLQMNYDKTYVGASGTRAYDILLAQMQFNVPKCLELAETLKNQKVSIKDKIFTDNADLFTWLNIDIKNWSYYQGMYSLEGEKIDITNSSDSRSIAFLIVSRIEDYDKLLNQLK